MMWTKISLALWLPLLYALCRLQAAEPTSTWPELTPGQRQRLAEFDAYRPSFVDAPGVWMLQAWDSDSGMEKLLAWPTGAGNAAEHFAKLEQLFPAAMAGPSQAGDSAGLQELLNAAECAVCRLSPDFYPEFDRSDARQPDFAVLRFYLQELLDSALRIEQAGGSRLEVEKRYQAGLICGRHLTNARTSSIVYITGLIFKVRSAQAYEQWLRRVGEEEKAAAAQRYCRRLTEIFACWNWKINVAMSMNDEFDSLPVIIRVALNDAEPFWRAEAVLRLATFRHGAVDQAQSVVRHHSGWGKAGETALMQTANNDPVPSIRRLAAWVAVAIDAKAFETFRHQF